MRYHAEQTGRIQHVTMWDMFVCVISIEIMTYSPTLYYFNLL